jgi:cobalt/nickel transport system permease protein
VHIAEGFLPPAHALAWTAAAAPFAFAGGRAVVSAVNRDPSARLRLGAAAGFCLLLSSLKLPSFAGSCSHPTGAGLGAILLGPAVMAGVCLVVLVYQALLLAHGGITTLGANLLALGVAGPWAAWLLYRSALAVGLRPAPATAIAAAVGSLATYALTAVQLGLAFPDAAGGTGVAIGKFAALFAPVQVPLALAEGALTAVALAALSRRSSPSPLSVPGAAR